MHKKLSKLISNGALIASALVTIPLAISACGGSSSNGGNNNTDSIGTINGHPVQLSAGNFSVNPKSDAPVGSIAIPGMSASESPITLTFVNPNPPAPQASFNPTPCIITASTPSCVVVINGSNDIESSYTYSVAYSINGSTPISLPGTMQVTTSNSIPKVRPGTLSISVESQLTVESMEQATITLSNSAGVNSLPITVAADNSKITLSASSCNLSTTSPTCNVTITAGNESGITTLEASATGYTSTSQTITVNPQPEPSIGIINGHPVQLSSGNFSVNPKSDAPVGSIAIPGMSTSESPIILTFVNPNPPAPQASFNPTPCIITESTPSCAVVINGSSDIESSYTYSVAYSINGSTPISLPGTMQVTTSNSIPEVRAGTLSISVENQLTVESMEQATITLNNSAGVNSLPVTVAADNSKITLSASSCNLSTNSPTCNVTITAGNESGNTILVASATGYTDSSQTITVNPQPEPAPTNKWVFISQSSPNGAMQVKDSDWQPEGANGIEKADAICMHDAESAGWIPNDIARSLTWKAMIVDGTNRAASPNPLNWVFTPNTLYVDIKTSIPLGTSTSSEVLTLPLAASPFSGPEYDWAEEGFLQVEQWTGLNSDWTSDMALNCEGWSTNAGWKMGRSGETLTPDGDFTVSENWIAKGSKTCNSQGYTSSAVRLVCVSQ